MSQLDAIGRRIAFARHIPPRQIAYRIGQRMRDRLLGPQFAAIDPATHRRPADTLPRRPFLPRAIDVRRESDAWHFVFLGRAVTMGGAIDWTAPGGGPADQLWRMNLHYMEYLEVLPRDDGRGAIMQWISGNPPERPGALSDAWNPYALSIRIVCWLQWLAEHGAALSQNDSAAIDSALLRQMAFLTRHLERDIGGNHLIKNIKALLWAAACFDGPDAADWRRTGRALLEAECARQILPDGVHFERSPSYHCQVLADLTECAAALDAPRRAALLQRTRPMMAAAAALSHPDGLSAQFNDAGLHMAYRPDAIAAARTMLGETADAARTTATLRDAGFLAWHHGGDALIVKCGNIAPDTLPAHGHGDVGSFELSVGGRRIVVDQGVFEYIEGPSRAASRAADHHNVAAPLGADMADFFGAFRIGRRPAVTLYALESQHALENKGDGAAHVDVGHDGFARDAGCAEMRRDLRVGPGRVEITDTASAPSGTGIVSRLLLHPDCTAEQTAGGAIIRCGPIEIALSCDGAVDIASAVYWPDMGVALETTRLVLPWAAATYSFQLIWDVHP